MEALTRNVSLRFWGNRTRAANAGGAGDRDKYSRLTDDGPWSILGTMGSGVNFPIGAVQPPIGRLAFPGCAGPKHKQPIMFGFPKTKWHWASAL